ncbi:MAG: RNA pseudouridine synthase, partial [Paracoccus sp. (in: a-proteobacteria)]
MSTLLITIPANPPDRLDKALALAVPEAAALSRSRLARLIAEGAVSGPGGVARDGKARVAEGQQYRIALPQIAAVETRPEPIPLTIV